jgi:hypothetical protein
MCFPRPEVAVGEMRRVLRPGGRAVIAAWGAREKNPLLALLMKNIASVMALPPPPADTPGFLFRHSAPGTVEALMTSAGFTDVKVEGFEWTSAPQTPQTVWRASKEVSPMAALIASTPPAVQANIEIKVLEALVALTGPDGNVAYPSHAWIGTGTAP